MEVTVESLRSNQWLPCWQTGRQTVRKRHQRKDLPQERGGRKELCPLFLPPSETFRLWFELVNSLISFATGLAPLVWTAAVPLLRDQKVTRDQTEPFALAGQECQSRGLAGLPSVPLACHWTPAWKPRCGTARTASIEEKTVIRYKKEDQHAQRLNKNATKEPNTPSRWDRSVFWIFCSRMNRSYPWVSVPADPAECFLMAPGGGKIVIMSIRKI